MEEIDCPVCGTANEEVAIRENGYAGRRCGVCGLIYISPRPEPDEVTELYDDYNRMAVVRRFGTSPLKRRFVAGRALDIVREHRPDGSLLEIGPGEGFFLQAASRHYDVAGLELDPTAAAFIERELGIPCETEPLAETTPFDRTFDAIYHRNVTSHLRDPVTAFERMADLLDDDGVLVFETGNIAEVDERHYDRYPEFQYPDHLTFFGEDSLTTLLERAGFTPVRTYRYATLPYFGLLAVLQPVVAAARGLVTDGDAGDEPAGRDARHENDGGTVDDVTADGDTASNRIDRSNPATDGAGSGERPSDGKLAVYRLLESVLVAVQYVLIYRLGRSLARPGHPQTMIVVARKADA